jgi:hypothetical protein
MKSFRTAALAILTALVGGACAQTQSAPAAASQVIGEVTARDIQAGQISLRTDKGEAVIAPVGANTVYLRVPPGEKDLKKATRIAFTDIGVGDRVLVIGQQTVIVMTRSDLAEKQQREQEEWQKRGTSGTVAAIDAAAKTFTMKSGQKTVTVQPSEHADYRRYAPDSVKFSDARPSSLAEIKTGDQVRVLGDKNDDGASIKAERIVSGSFRQIAATVTSIHAGAGEIVIKDLATKKPLTVRVNSDSTMRKLPPEMAAMLARRYQPGGGPGEGQAARGGGGDVGQMLDRLPAMALSELKPGDAIMLSSTTGSDPARVTAVMLLAGVEPLLTASPTATRDIMSGWNLGGAAGDVSQ